MSTSTLRERVLEGAREFAWGQWAQLGLLAESSRRDTWAIDPEALVLFSLEVGRDEPRLFDEVLDWMLVNERLLSVQRLRNFADGEESRALVDAALAWVARYRPRQRLKTPRGDALPSPADAESLFRAARGARSSDETFLAHGFARGHLEPSGKSRPPNLVTPPAFAFRIRQVLGLSARAEVIRFLLTVDAPRVTAAVVAETAGYSKRNVHEALSSLAAARVIEAVVVGNEQRYGVDKARWAQLFDLDELPRHRDWPQLLRATLRLLRWLRDPRYDELSYYMLSSEARLLLETLERDLRDAGVAMPPLADDRDHWARLEDVIERLVAELG